MFEEILLVANPIDQHILTRPFLDQLPYITTLSWAAQLPSPGTSARLVHEAQLRSTVLGVQASRDRTGPVVGPFWGGKEMQKGGALRELEEEEDDDDDDDDDEDEDEDEDEDDEEEDEDDEEDEDEDDEEEDEEEEDDDDGQVRRF